MTRLHVDTETYSPIDLKKAGAYRYAEQVEVTLFQYAFDDGPIEVVDRLGGERLPRIVREALVDPDVEKHAFNAAFERAVLQGDPTLRIPCPPEQWHCTQALALSAGLPASLAEVAAALKLDVRKDPRGWALIRFFCMPCKPTKKNGGRTRNLPEHDPERWAQFIAYGRQDVATERAVYAVLKHFPMRPVDRATWVLDQHINDRGMRVDLELIDSAIAVDDAYRERLLAQAESLLPPGTNPNSVKQLKEWLEGEIQEPVEDLKKKTVKAMAPRLVGTDAGRMLAIRQELAKSSVKKYRAARTAVCRDGRVRGLYQFSGAARTGRWGGRLVQTQNLPQNHLANLAMVRELMRRRDIEAIEALYGSIPQVLSELLRTIFIAGEGCTLKCVDFKAVEARFLAWVAGEEWRMEVFRTHGKIYEASASQMFKVPLEQITKGNPLRQKGKVAELALGYGGGANALVTMGALEMGLTEDELEPIKYAWRDANPAIVQLWYAMENAAKRAIAEGGRHKVNDKVSFIRQGRGPLQMILPSRRRLTYWFPDLQESKRFPGSQSITFMGVDQKTGQWTRLDTFGGRLVENLCQAGCNDILREALLGLEAEGYLTAGHVHDEAITDDDLELAGAEAVFARSPAWAPDLPLGGDGFVTPFYRKDD